MNNIFKGLKILDLSSVLAGPSVATFFAEMGAVVTKLEHPLFGDVTRTWKLPSETEENQISSYFAAVNYGKKYISFDLGDPNRRQELETLIQSVDILISNFKKGDAEKFGLTDEVLKNIHPLLIHGKISGFGTDSDRIAYDLILQAETGFMSINGGENDPPTKMPVALIDVLAAHHLKEGLLIALLRREKEKVGSVLEVSLYDAAVASLMNQATAYLMCGKIGKRLGSKHPNIAPYGELFTTSDEQLITLAIGSNKHFELLCQTLNLDNLNHEERFKDNQQRVIHRSDLEKILQEKIKLWTSKELLETLILRNIPCGKVKQLDEVLNESKAKKLILEEDINGQKTARIRSNIIQWK